MIVERIKDRFGSVLAFVLLVLFVMTLVTFAIASLSSRNIANVVGEYWEDRARYGAYSGVHRALTELAGNPGFSGGVSYINVPLDGDPQIQWSIQVDNNVLSPTGKYAPDAKTWIPPGCVWIHSVGTLRNLAASGVSSLAAIISPQRPVFDHAVFASNQLTMISSQTYSYFPGANGEKLAHIATNLITPAAINVLDGSRVDGDAIYGVDPTPPPTGAVVFGGLPAGTQTGATKAADEEKIVTPFVSPIPATGAPPGDVINVGDGPGTWTLAPGHHGTLRILDGQTVILDQGGTYYFQGSIEIRGDYDPNWAGPIAYPSANPPVLRVNTANVTAANPAVVYFDGDLIVHAGAQVNWNLTGTPPKPMALGVPLVGAPEAPRLLQFYSTDDTASAALTPAPPHIIIQETAQTSFVAAGLRSELEMQSAELYGALIVDTAHIEDSVVNFDIGLRGVPLDGSGGFQVLSMTAEDKGSAEAAAAATTTTNPAAPAPPAPPVTTAPPQPPPAAAPPAPAPPPPGTPPPPVGSGGPAPVFPAAVP